MIYNQNNYPGFLSLWRQSFKEPISDSYFSNEEKVKELMQFFDKEGFELTDLEGKYVIQNSFNLTDKAFGHRAIGWNWIESHEIAHKDIYVDHSYIVFRPGFVREAREQITYYATQFPILHKLLNIKPKIGLDIALEYVTKSLITEVVHIEMDYHDVVPAWYQLLAIQNTLQNTNWETAMATIQLIEPAIRHLPSDDQSDIKARLLGFTRTYQTLKTV